MRNDLDFGFWILDFGFRIASGQVMEAPERLNAGSELADAGREFYRRGWVLGTSGNFSMLTSRDPMHVVITASGLEKGKLDDTSFLELDENSKIVRGSGKSSAETELHHTIYRARPHAGSVLHTHSVWGTILSDEFFDRGAIEIEGYEMLKGLSGVTTHEHKEIVPVIANSQDYAALSRQIDDLLRELNGIHGFYLHRHGLYTWGETVAEARRHVEIFEFLFEVVGRSGAINRR
jgi:methylthioribulose-1-phosphate dehydratase